MIFQIKCIWIGSNKTYNQWSILHDWASHRISLPFSGLLSIVRRKAHLFKRVARIGWKYYTPSSRFRRWWRWKFLLRLCIVRMMKGQCEKCWEYKPTTKDLKILDPCWNSWKKSLLRVGSKNSLKQHDSPLAKIVQQSQFYDRKMVKKTTKNIRTNITHFWGFTRLWDLHGLGIYTGERLLFGGQPFDVCWNWHSMAIGIWKCHCCVTNPTLSAWKNNSNWNFRKFCGLTAKHKKIICDVCATTAYSAMAVGSQDQTIAYRLLGDWG